MSSTADRPFQHASCNCKAYRFPVLLQTDLAIPQTCLCHVSILFGCSHVAESQGSWRNLPVWRELLCYGQVPWTCDSQGAKELYRQLEGANQFTDHVTLHFVVYQLSGCSEISLRNYLQYRWSRGCIRIHACFHAKLACVLSSIAYAIAIAPLQSIHAIMRWQTVVPLNYVTDFVISCQSRHDYADAD